MRASLQSDLRLAPGRLAAHAARLRARNGRVDRIASQLLIRYLISLFTTCRNLQLNYVYILRFQFGLSGFNQFQTSILYTFSFFKYSFKFFQNQIF